MINRVLVTGGAGYVGAHMCKYLADRGHHVVVVDDLSTGHREALRFGVHHLVSIHDRPALVQILRQERIDAVIHFAASSVVSESVIDPLKYYENNVAGTAKLLAAMREVGVSKLVFSSSAAVYGKPMAPVIDETHPTAPINPYGQSKLMGEAMLKDCAAAYGLSAIALRYFNAAGADPSGTIGESHQPETHLIPRLLQRASGMQCDVGIFGNDYDTKDGTCIRDYVHVNDLAAAHLNAIELMSIGMPFMAINLGNGRGSTVLEVVRAVEQVVGKKLNLPIFPSRLGDPCSLVASRAKAEQILGWVPVMSDLSLMVESAWKWHLSRTY